MALTDDLNRLAAEDVVYLSRSMSMIGGPAQSESGMNCNL
jgi:hypothetical protein